MCKYNTVPGTSTVGRERVNNDETSDEKKGGKT